MSQVLFFIAAIGALTGAVGVVMVRNPFYSVLMLIVHLICLAALYLLLRAEFVAAAQVVVYAGAVMVLYVFVVAYVGGVEETVGGEGAIGRVGPVFAGALLVELCIAIIGSALPAIDSRGPHVAAGFGSPGAIGKLRAYLAVSLPWTSRVIPMRMSFSPRPCCLKLISRQRTFKLLKSISSMHCR